MLNTLFKRVNESIEGALYPDDGRPTNNDGPVDLNDDAAIRANPKGCYPDQHEPPKIKDSPAATQELKDSIELQKSIDSFSVNQVISKLCAAEFNDRDPDNCSKLKTRINQEIEQSKILPVERTAPVDSTSTKSH